MTQDPQDDPLERFKRLQKQPASDDPIERFKALKAAQSLATRPAAESTGHGAVKTEAGDSDFTRRPIAAESTGALSRSRPNATGDFEAAGPAAAANVLSAAQVLPGMEAFEAGAGALGSKLTSHPMSYRESLDALRSQTDAIPGPIKAAGRMLAGGPLTALPVSPMASGAILGGASQALDADPDRGLASRAIGTLVGTGIGAGIGAGADALVTKARATAAPASSRVIRDIKTERDAAAGPMFHSALTQGQGITALDPDVAMFISQPKVKDIIDGLKGLKEFQSVSDDSPEMLDAVYKVLSDQSAAAKRGLEAVTPNKPNLGRFTARDIRATKDEALDAMDSAMPDYRTAVKTYADYSGRIGAVRKGQDAVRGTLSKAVTTGKNLDRTTPVAFEDLVEKMTPEEREAATQGILGATKQATRAGSPLKAISALVKTPSLLRAANTPQQRAIDALIRAGLITGSTLAPR